VLRGLYPSRIEKQVNGDARRSRNIDITALKKKRCTDTRVFKIIREIRISDATHRYVKDCYDEVLQANKDVGEIGHFWISENQMYIFITVTSL